MLKNIHEKLLNCVQTLLIDTRINLPYYGEFNLHVNFHEQENIGTCAVNVTSKGMNFYYSPKFMENLSQKEVNFITLHEDFHLIFDHPKRTITGQYNHKLSNIAQDMIINHIIWEDISHDFVEIPKDPQGRNMALFIPKEYKGKLIFEELYEWLKEKKDEHQKSKGQKSESEGDGDGEGDGEGQKNDSGKGDGKSDSKKYGPYGKNPSKEGGTIDTWSLDQILEDMENNNGEYLDKHIGDDVPEEMRDAMVKDVMDKLKSRGFESGNIEQTMNKLRKKRKDYLKEIKRAVSNLIFGTVKQKTIVKPNRRQIQGIKGNRKVKTKINVILDVSGSMSGLTERVLNYVFRNDIEMNLIQADTKVNAVENLKSGRKLEKVKLIGFGGTILMPAVKYVVENFNQYNTVILSDGYTDSLDLSEIRGKVLIISAGVKVPISKSNGKVKQIIVDESIK